MRNWRKMTWAILIWTVLMFMWIVGGASAAGATPVTNEYEEAGRAIGTGIGVTMLFMLWFVGFIILSIIWFMSRPKNNVLVYGPSGQQMTVSEKEAKKRVDKQGWTYQAQAAQASATPVVEGLK
jgi:hypothetical protein